ncbi:MAG TPA: TRL domain-containing protein [Kiritimatiellia bacterium]|nr:TRL domain-containing protein [Kiritimatiellia bacterium]
MKRLMTLGVLAVVAASMTGCGVIPQKGTSMAAITIDHVASDPIVDNSVRPVKKGVASSKAIILFNTGDASIDAAMREGGITKVHHVNYDVTNILFLYNEIKTTVYGE